MQIMADQNTKHNASPSLAHSITPYPGTVASHYDCPCGRCSAGPSTYTSPPYGGRLSFRNDSRPPSVPYVEDTRRNIMIPPRGPYFLNDNVSFFSDDSPDVERRRGFVRSGISHVRAIAVRARASLDIIRKPQRQSNGTASDDSRLPPILSSDEIEDEIADEDGRRRIRTAETEPAVLKRRITTKEKVRWWIQTSKTVQTAETEPMGLKRPLTAKKKVRGWIQTAETEPMGLKRRKTAKEKVGGWIQTAETEPMGLKRRKTAKEKVRGWIQAAETEPMGLKRSLSAKKKFNGWFHDITGGDKFRSSLERKMSVVSGEKRTRKTNKPAIVGLRANILGIAPPDLSPLIFLLPPPAQHSDDDH